MSGWWGLAPPASLRCRTGSRVHARAGGALYEAAVANHVRGISGKNESGVGASTTVDEVHIRGAAGAGPGLIFENGGALATLDPIRAKADEDVVAALSPPELKSDPRTSSEKYTGSKSFPLPP